MQPAAVVGESARRVARGKEGFDSVRCGRALRPVAEEDRHPILVELAHALNGLAVWQVARPGDRRAGIGRGRSGVDDREPKQAVLYSVGRPLRDGIAFETDTFSYLCKSEDWLAGQRAFLSHGTATFKGR